MRRQLIATTSLIALAAILVLGIPLGVVESARARSDALTRLEREADGIAAAIDDRAETASRVRHPLAHPSAAPRARRRGGRVRAVAAPRADAVGRPARRALRGAAGRAGDDLRLGGRGHAPGAPGLAADRRPGAGRHRRGGRPGRPAGPPLHPSAPTADRDLGSAGAGDFSARTGRLALPEFDRVAIALDGAAARIAQLVGRQREFTANVSHQLRTPLTAMRLRLDELATLEDPEAARAELEATLRVADRLERTVADLLALARAGDLGTPRDVDLAALARDHAASWRPVFARAGRSLQLTVESPLARAGQPGWRGAGARRAAGERDRARRRDHAAGGARAGRPLPDRRDRRGAGRPPALEARIFERDVSTAGSTGIGLSLARALVEADGGRLVLAQPSAAAFRDPHPAAPALASVSGAGRRGSAARPARPAPPPRRARRS